MGDSAWDPHCAIGWHNPDIVFRTTNYRPIQSNNQLPFTVRMNRHFGCVINEIDMTSDCGARRAVGIKQRIGKSGCHVIGNI